MIYNELPVAFPWYEKIEMQNRYIETVDEVCDFKLITPANALLPFQFAVEADKVIENWRVYEINEPQLVEDLTSQLALLDVQEKAGKQYVTYHGSEITDMSLPGGFYFSSIKFTDGSIMWSEMFHIPNADKFTVNQTNINFLKIEWYNYTDLPPIFYNDLELGVPKFKNTIYLDTFIYSSQPEISEETEPDGNDEEIPVFQKVFSMYAISEDLPDFLKKAVSLLPLHDVVNLTTKGGVRSGRIEGIEVQSATQINGALAETTIRFKETLIIKKGCGQNME